MTDEISIKSDQTLFLDEPPSCLEFCPTAPDFLVVGTYNLVTDGSITKESSDSEPTQVKDGSLIVFQIVNERL